MKIPRSERSWDGCASGRVAIGGSLYSDACEAAVASAPQYAQKRVD
jgi:hypothetical protein